MNTSEVGNSSYSYDIATAKKESDSTKRVLSRVGVMSENGKLNDAELSKTSEELEYIEQKDYRYSNRDDDDKEIVSEHEEMRDSFRLVEEVIDQSPSSLRKKLLYDHVQNINISLQKKGDGVRSNRSDLNTLELQNGYE
jgi:hypothetical protein